ncbi:MAG: hypothetical protein RJA98_391, partial [Pseudomonadota bacterium]
MPSPMRGAQCRISFGPGPPPAGGRLPPRKPEAA